MEVNIAGVSFILVILNKVSIVGVNINRFVVCESRSMDAISFHSACIAAMRFTHSDVMSTTITLRPFARIEPTVTPTTKQNALPSKEEMRTRSKPGASVKVPIKKAKRCRLLHHERKQFLTRLSHERRLRAQLEGHASVQAQRIVRGHLARISLLQPDNAPVPFRHGSSNQREADVRGFLKQFKRDVAKAQQLVPKQRHKKMAVRLQSVARGFVTRRALRPVRSYALLIKQNAAARKVQSVWRCYSITLRSNAQVYSEMHRAAIRIQALIRGRHRRAFVSLLHQAMEFETNNVRSAVKIQALFRKKAAVQTKENKRFDNASLRIQKTYRIHHTRRQIKEEYRAAAKIQATLRGRRQRMYLQQQREDNAATRIQSLHRGRVFRTQHKKSRREAAAAVVIQSANRKCLAKKELNKRQTAKQERHEAAVAIQSTIRKRQARNELDRRIVCHTERAATTIQCAARKRGAQNAAHQRRQDKAARVLQKAERKRQKLLEEKRQQSAIRIQKTYRGGKVRRVLC